MLIFYVSKILGSVSKGCPQLEYIDLKVCARENPLPAELIALASLPSLRSVLILMFGCRNSRKMTPEEIEDLRVSLTAIVEQGLLEVSYISPSSKISLFLQKPR